MFKIELHTNKFYILEQPSKIKRGCGTIYSYKCRELKSKNFPETTACNLYIHGVCQAHDSQPIMLFNWKQDYTLLKEYCKENCERFVVKLGK